MVILMTVMFDKLSKSAATAVAPMAANLPRGPRFAAIDTELLDRLDNSADRLRLAAFPKMCTLDLLGAQQAVFCGTGQPATAGMMALCRAAGAAVDLCPDLADLTRYLHQPQHQARFAVIDLQAIGGLDANFDQLRRLRVQHPRVALLLVSAAFRYHDFSAERLGLADAWIHAPLDMEDLADLLVRSLENNAKWAATQAAQHH